ncbi:hypothetical protein IW261DRAFT_1428883 [Armillaria novae-zelandiae]|uniref:Uncharacterized protein n=1 Tax=Armillaria novae-zelandiae TaxID=153914 RepID=A0AA39N832_9AGAR|nr:hypothetical protein IW261DRAFT_1428883 [Armillaria novae-zelandiae]
MSKPFDGAAPDHHVNITSLSSACERFCTFFDMHHFLHLHLGVMVIAGLTFLSSVCIAAAGRINVKDILKSLSSQSYTTKKSVWISAGIYAFIALVSLFGLFAAFKAKVKLVDAFNVIMLRIRVPK